MCKSPTEDQFCKNIKQLHKLYRTFSGTSLLLSTTSACIYISGLVQLLCELVNLFMCESVLEREINSYKLKV